MNKYRFNLEVPYFACDPEGYMTPTYILNYFGEASSAHSDYLNLGVKELMNLNYGWILNRWKLYFLSYPRVKEKISIETWTSSVNRFYANREFILYNEENEILAKATTVWVFLDLEKQRPIRIPKEIEERYNCNDEPVFQDFYNFKETEIKENSKVFATRKSDIDYNKHVNNVKYLDWILEVIPETIDANYWLHSLEIQYKKEILYGDQIVSSISKKEKNEDSLYFLHKIKKEDEEVATTYARTGWTRKNKI